MLSEGLSEVDQWQAGERDQQGGLVAHQTLAQALDGAHRRTQRHRDERDRSGLLHGPVHAQRKRGHGQDPTARTRQAQDGADQGAEQGTQSHPG